MQAACQNQLAEYWWVCFSLDSLPSLIGPFVGLDAEHCWWLTVCVFVMSLETKYIRFITMLSILTVAFTILRALHFHIFLESSLSLPTKELAEILIDSVFNLWINLRKTDTLAILNPKIYEQCFSWLIYTFSPSSQQCFVVQCVGLLHVYSDSYLSILHFWCYYIGLAEKSIWFFP